MKLIIACLAENNRSYHKKVLSLFHSIREFGGKLNSAVKIAHFVGSLDESVKEALEKMDVKTRIVESLDTRSPHSNKIRMLEIEDEYDVLLMLDCDMVVTNDFYEYLSSEVIMAKPCNTHTLRTNEWESLFGFFEVKMPGHRVKTTYTNRYIVPYFNSGFVAVPYQYSGKLYEMWKYWAIRLLDSYGDMNDAIQNQKFYTDQFALTLALSQGELPYYVLDIAFNFSTHHAKAEHISDELQPYILHYHYHVDDEGLLKKTGYKTVDQEIDKINKMISNIW